MLLEYFDVADQPDVVGLLPSIVELPGGKKLASASLYHGIMNSGVWYEHYKQRGTRQHLRIKREVLDAVSNWLINSEAQSDGFMHGYAEMPLSEYLKRMFVNE